MIDKVVQCICRFDIFKHILLQRVRLQNANNITQTNNAMSIDVFEFPAIAGRKHRKVDLNSTTYLSSCLIFGIKYRKRMGSKSFYIVNLLNEWEVTMCNMSEWWFAHDSRNPRTKYDDRDIISWSKKQFRILTNRINVIRSRYCSYYMYINTFKISVEMYLTPGVGKCTYMRPTQIQIWTTTTNREKRVVHSNFQRIMNHHPWWMPEAALPSKKQ